MQEMTEQELESLLAFHHEGCAVFLYTPMCGTCAAARKMLDVLQAMDDQLPLYACNMNMAPKLAQAWRIESVPCIAFIKHGEIHEKIYAMHSVPVLYDKFVRFGLMSPRS